jgi:hypothetical protein
VIELEKGSTVINIDAPNHTIRKTIAKIKVLVIALTF